MADCMEIVDFITEATSSERELVERIVNCHPNISIESREVNDIITLLFEGLLCAEKWLLQHEKPKEREFACQICMDDFKVSEMYTISCDSSHRFCYECVDGHVNSKLKDKTFISCPAPQCQYQLTPSDLAEIGRHPEEIENYEEWLSKKVIESKAIACPGKDCKVFIYPSDETICEPCPCPQCEIDFCSKCKREYHWRSKCTDVPNIEQRWLNWCLQGRQQHWQRKAALLKQLETEYEKAKQQHAKSNQELKKRFEELNKDEAYKKGACKTCPNCARVIEKLEGCDAMKCGTDYHGGNAQNGCGHKFKWSEAPAYVPASVALRQEEFKIPEPKLMENVVHEYYKCDACKSDIVGIRFSCLNCKAFDLCEQCDVRGKGSHYANHVFKIFTANQTE